MAWRDELLPASFRGVPFFVEAAPSRAGRSVVLHEYPVSDGSNSMPWAEDTGAAARVHRIEGYILSEEFVRDAKVLLDALDEPGPGTLVHPYLGSFEAVAVDPEVLFTKREGRLARFGLTFIQTAFPYPTAPKGDPAGETTAAAKAVEDAAGESFEEIVHVDDAPAWVEESTTGVIGKVLEVLRDVDFSFPGEQQLAEYTRVVDEIGQGVVDILRGGNLPEHFHTAFVHLEQAVTSKIAALEFYLEFAEFRASVYGYLSDAGKKADSNARAVERLFRELAMSRASAIAVEVEWPSYDDATAARGKISDGLEALFADASDESFNKLVALRAALFESVPPEDESLPRIARVTLPAVSSSILVAYQNLGRTEREGEIVERNDVPWPGLIPKGAELELLIAAR